jgi:hypothetical protein
VYKLSQKIRRRKKRKKHQNLIPIPINLQHDKESESSWNIDSKDSMVLMTGKKDIRSLFKQGRLATQKACKASNS